ncbi:Asp/Glu/hydantoin racemase [Rhodocollybia butyracea]|uniref:Asp/Glu/hydantoin racemase n=1 Tax=Rhodocollybia butyracea TaxID=206335 RepID=A0A9P5U7P5_9AGAR|nr:Asp/Glu/hydantoin racemase [Rhodocollybia butyracea]
MAPTRLLIINPNSSKSVTDGLEEVLQAPPQTELTFYTAPSNAPPSINDMVTGNLSATACFLDIKEKKLLDKFDGFLVCCFSDHPLTYMLRETTSKPVIGIFESAITQSLLLGKRFGIVTTGTGYQADIRKGVQAFMGGHSQRFAGLVTTGLGVVELREGDRQKIEANMKEYSGQIARMGADVIILGCAGMTGMESLVVQGAAEADPMALPVLVVDGAKAGVEMLAGLVRFCSYASVPPM